jgi:large subunit ribosomal protein L24
MAMMKIKKGDIVQMLRGKDRGKRGRVIEAEPSKRRVFVENLNTVKRHTRPRPLKDASRMGGTQMAPGGVMEKASAVPVDSVMLVCPTCQRATRVAMAVKDVKGEKVKVRQCKRADCREEIDR